MVNVTSIWLGCEDGGKGKKSIVIPSHEITNLAPGVAQALLIYTALLTNHTHFLHLNQGFSKF